MTPSATRPTQKGETMKLRYTALNDAVKEVEILETISDTKWKVKINGKPRYWYGGSSGLFTIKQSHRGRSQKRISWYAPEVITG